MRELDHVRKTFIVEGVKKVVMSFLFYKKKKQNKSFCFNENLSLQM